VALSVASKIEAAERSGYLGICGKFTTTCLRQTFQNI